MRAGVIVAGLLMGMLVVSGCGPDEESGAEAEESVTPTAAPAQSKAATPEPAAAKLTPEARRNREMLYGGLAKTHPEATKDQLTCASDEILEQIGWPRFRNLLVLEMNRAAGQSPKPSAEATADRTAFDAIISGCGMTPSRPEARR